MKRKLSVILASLLFFTAILFSRFYNVSAQPKVLNDAELGNALSTLTSTPIAGSIIHITPTPSPQTDNEERILRVLKNLVNLANSNYLHAGWLYCSSESQIFTSDQKTLPDGSPLPLKSNHHSWYRLDDAGKVLQAISFEDTGDSLSSQFSVYQNGMWKNITLGTSFAEENYTLKLDNGIVESVKNLGETDTVSMKFTSLNGANVVKIEKRYYYPKPTQFVDNDTRKYIGDAITQYLDQETGLITQIDQSHIKLDGSLEVTDRIFNFTCEKQPNALSVYFNPPD
jgi:hypothetical protein